MNALLIASLIANGIFLICGIIWLFNHAVNRAVEKRLRPKAKKSKPAKPNQALLLKKNEVPAQPYRIPKRT